MNSNDYYQELNLGNKIKLIGSPAFCETYPVHWHKYIELIYYPEDAVCHKKPVWTIENEEYHLSPGDILFIWSGELHSIVSNNSVEVTGLQFSSTILYELPDFLPYVNQLKGIRLLSYEDDPELVQTLQYYLHQIADLDHKKTDFYGVEKMILLLEFFMLLAKRFQTQLKDVDNYTALYTSETLSKIQAACTYISENCEHELSLTDVANHTGYSHAYFSKLFKKITSCSFVEYLTAQRLKTAQVLLADFDIPVTEVAYRSGFKSISTFNRVFRQYKGCSPSDFRKYYDLQN